MSPLTYMFPVLEFKAMSTCSAEFSNMNPFPLPLSVRKRMALLVTSALNPAVPALKDFPAPGVLKYIPQLLSLDDHNIMPRVPPSVLSLTVTLPPTKLVLPTTCKRWAGVAVPIPTFDALLMTSDPS